jgi:hypothetical protein
MTAATFHCPLCAKDVYVVMHRTGYCVDCNAESEKLWRRRNVLLNRKAAER